MTTAPDETQDTERAPVRSLTRGQITVLTIATLPMIGVGAAGAIGTYANASSVLHRGQTALGVVAAGEGATLVAALVMIGVTMLGQTAPATIRAALWLLPTAASVMGLTIAPTMREAVVYALTPLAMTAAAEGVSFLARRIVVHRTGIDMEAQRRNAATMQRMAVLRALATSHPNAKARKRAELASWRLAKKVGAGDAALGAYLVTVQRDRMTTGADIALAAMFTPGVEAAVGRLGTPALEIETAETETVVSRRTETTETTETSETSETGLPASPVSRPTETSETGLLVSGRNETPETETSETGETETSLPVSLPGTPRETSKVTSIGDRETETNALLDLMRSRGGEMAVSLNNAIEETGRPKATAAKRLKAARDLYLAETA